MSTTRYKRIFVVISPTAKYPQRPVRGIAGSTGRLDVILRSALAALGYGLAVRRDSIFIGYAAQTSTVIEIWGSEVEYMPDSEVELFKMLCSRCRGFYVKSMNLKEFKSHVSALCRGTCIYLKEDGIPIENIDLGTLVEPLCFFLGAHVDIDEYMEKELGLNSMMRVSLGGISYMTYQCIIIMNRILDLWNHMRIHLTRDLYTK